MKKSLKYISISHLSAKLPERECFHLTKIRQYQWFGLLRKQFGDISGLMILSTCNRTEIYFESDKTSAAVVRNFFILETTNSVSRKEKALFQLCNSTRKTIVHLLQVSNGLLSAVAGDAQIPGQVKEAWLQSIQLEARGSLLERAMQTVARTRKRVVNETGFFTGSQSTAYLALKLITDNFGCNQLATKKLLLVGAGDIGKQLIQYLPKFGFQDVCIANRTETKSASLAKQYRLKTFPWEKVEQNKLDEFDAIITAVSNCQNLITKVGHSDDKRVFIDLGMPANILPELQKSKQIKLYSLDQISEQLELNEQNRYTSLFLVEAIIKEEAASLMRWVNMRKVHAYLSRYKQATTKLLHETISRNPLTKRYKSSEIEQLVNRISSKLVKESALVLLHGKKNKRQKQN